MSIIVSSISLPWDAPEQMAIDEAFRRCGMPQTGTAGIYRQSIDARRGTIKKVYSVLISGVAEEERLLRLPGIRQKKAASAPVIRGERPLSYPPVICGAGPAGLFAAYFLAKNGYRPIVLERGKEIARRDEDVAAFFAGQGLQTDSNIPFGEGGAGAYSDGKLTTRISDPYCELVLETLAAFGAPADILRLAKPHIGTDILKTVVHRIRREIQRLGGQVCFSARLTGIIHKNGRLTAAVVNGETLPCGALVLAIGHSARDTFFQLYRDGVEFLPKAFSVGVRVEHLQAEINRAMYGKDWEKLALPPAEYTLSCKSSDGRGVYSFCMCPGGQVVAAQSEENTIVTNGMSYHARDGKNANAALVASVSPADFDGVFGGVTLQRQIEQAAYRATGSYAAPGMTVASFLGTGPGKTRVEPTYPLGVRETELDRVLPEFVCRGLRQGLPAFGRKIRGFDDGGAVLTAPETRTSSPVRMVRQENLQSAGIAGLFPCGEGAGYAGGIVSAAVDGIRCAGKIMEEYKPE